MGPVAPTEGPISPVGPIGPVGPVLKTFTHITINNIIARHTNDKEIIIVGIYIS
jgi:hypothetical protein